MKCQHRVQLCQGPGYPCTVGTYVVPGGPVAKNGDVLFSGSGNTTSSTSTARNPTREPGYPRTRVRLTRKSTGHPERDKFTAARNSFTRNRGHLQQRLFWNLKTYHTRVPGYYFSIPAVMPLKTKFSSTYGAQRSTWSLSEEFAPVRACSILEFGEFANAREYSPCMRASPNSSLRLKLVILHRSLRILGVPRPEFRRAAADTPGSGYPGYNGLKVAHFAQHQHPG
eukprot:1503222-Rhodomonas_salina.1